MDMSWYLKVALYAESEYALVLRQMFIPTQSRLRKDDHCSNLVIACRVGPNKDGRRSSSVSGSQ